MAAGQKYDKTLNYDQNNVKTPAFHDPNLDEWLMASANVVKTEGGVFVFQKGTDDGKAKVSAELTGSIEAVNNSLVTGSKTVTATAAELFAGASTKANRRYLKIKNEDPILRMRIGASNVTQQNGDPIEPGAMVIILFNPAIAVSIYGISEGVSLKVSVTEV